MKLGIIFGIMLVLAIGLILLPLLAKSTKRKSAGKNTKTFAFLAGMIAVAAAGVYLVVGNPELANKSTITESFDGTGQGDMLPSVDEMMERLRARLEQNPDDVDGWATLAKSLLMVERYGEAADAYRQTIILAPGIAELHSALGEALTLSNDGFITPEAAQAFETALELDPGEVISKFYLGDYAFQEGDVQLAFERWVALYEELPGDTPWLSLLDQRIREAAARLGRDPAAILAEKQPEDPAALSAEEIQQMSSTDQQAMIEGMVASLAARLEENPDDLEGWQRLGRSYMVLGRYQEGADAFAIVAGARPDDPAAQEQYVQAIMTYLEQTGQHISDEALVALRRLIGLDPENPTALYFLGQAAAERGDPASARLYWQRLLALIPPDSDGAEIVRQRLGALD